MALVLYHIFPNNGHQIRVLSIIRDQYHGQKVRKVQKCFFFLLCKFSYHWPIATLMACSPLARSSSNSVNHRDNYYKNPPRPFKSPIRLLLKAVAAQKSHSVEFFKASICRNPPLTFAEVMLLRSAEWFEPFLLLAHILRCFLLKDQSWCSHLYRRGKKNSDSHKTVIPT